LAGEGGGVGAEVAAGVDGGADAGADSVPDDGPEFLAPGVDEIAINLRAMVGAIVAEIGGDGAGTEVDVFAKVGVANVAEVANGRTTGEDRVFDFDSVADVAVVADGGGATEVAIGSNLAVFTNDNGAFDEDAGKDFGSFANDDFGFVTGLNGGMAGPVLNGGDELGVEVKELPRVGQVEGLAEKRLPVGDGFTGEVEGGFVV